MEFDKLLKKALDLLIEKLNPVAVYLFGSAARDELREDSDIDIAYLSDINLSPYENFMFAQELADIFKRDVDLINLKEASTVFKAQIVGTGKRIYCSDENRKMYFEMISLKEYKKINKERSIFLKESWGERVPTESNIIYNKIETIERCIDRINEVYGGNPESLKDYTKQDSIILNIQRACEASIDIAMLYQKRGWGYRKTAEMHLMF